MWQAFYSKHRGAGFELLSIAVDVQGAEVVRPYTTKHSVTFPVAVDATDVFGQAFGLKAIPVTYLIDEIGIIRLQGGGPSKELLDQIERILGEPMVAVPSRPPSLPIAWSLQELELEAAKDPETAAARLALGQAYASSGRFREAAQQLARAAELDPADAAVFLAWGMALLADGQRDLALTKLRQARDLAPDNWRIRKQIWAVENPDRFYTDESPDYGWQREQLKRERTTD